MERRGRSGRPGRRMAGAAPALLLALLALAAGGAAAENRLSTTTTIERVTVRDDGALVLRIADPPESHPACDPSAVATEAGLAEHSVDWLFSNAMTYYQAGRETTIAYYDGTGQSPVCGAGGYLRLYRVGM